MKGGWIGLGAALLIQVGLLAAIPWKRTDVGDEARDLWLLVRAGDRQDVMQGAYLRLDYEISQLPPATDAEALNPGQWVYVVLRQTDPGVWSSVRVETEWPGVVRSDWVLIRGRIEDRGLVVHTYLSERDDGSWAADSVVTRPRYEPHASQLPDRAVATAWVRRPVIVYSDIESFFVPEARRSELAAALREHPNAVAAQVRVDGTGAAALLQVRVGEQVYRF